MIKHVIRYISKKFDYEWIVELPYRLCAGDFINESFFNYKDVYNPKHEDCENDDEWFELCSEQVFFEVKEIQIEHNIIIANIE